MILLHTRDEVPANHLLHSSDAIWIPPEAADDMVEMEDYAILQLTTTDDDDDDGEESDEEASDDDADGASSSLICSRYRSDADERQKAMVRAMNGQLKMLAARFLESAGIDSCCWLDVVTSLSWEAALFIRPDATAGNEMDPCSYLKVKCLAASAAPACSEVVRGLVFSKKAAHKHMPTRCHNPRLLLLGGALGDSGHTALSSLSSVQQEKKHLQDSVRRMVEICRPNVIMVEKTVSRDIQELLLEEGVTLVPDMKLTRLRRIARCSASPIILDFPSDEPSLLKLKPKLKRCDYFHIEKVAGTCKSRQSNKTLMFLQGFHKPLGCTILLRGANSEELKKVKQVMLYTVFAAYHLVLETSFFEDQRVILDNHVSAREPPTHGETVITISSKQIDHLNSTDDQSQPKRSFHYQNIYLPVLTSSQEATTDHHRKEAGALQCNQDMVLHTQFGSGENVDHLSSDPQNEGNQHITLLDDHDPWVSGKHDEQPSTPLENVSDVDEVDDVLESQSILILLSSQCITKQVICEQSHLSRINYYGNSDVSLGRYLQDILQNQNLSCSSCGEPPEAHMYSYTHRNGNLTVLVKRLPKYHLPGESQGKIWMWTRCLRCEHESGISRSSPRVVMSTEAHYLSFGKFLELSFSSHSTARRLSICGHSLNKDCLRFFGLGSKVAMFQYSSVEIYAACKPQPTLEFHNPNTHEWYGQELRNVLARGVMLFSQVTGFLKDLKDQFSEVAILPIKEFSQLEDMLIREKSEFMCTLAQAVDLSGTPSSVHEILNVNWLYQDLLLELYVWDRRLHQLLEYISAEKERMGIGINRTYEFTDDQTDVVAEADCIAECTNSNMSFDNGCIKPEKFSRPGIDTTLLDENAPEKWVWNPLHESRLAYRQELEVGCLERFELVNRYCPSHLSPLDRHKQSDDEVGSPQFTVGPGGNVLCVSEDEISSIISRALAISEERRHLLDAITESEPADSRGGEGTKTMDKSYSSLSESSSSAWSSSGSSDSEASTSSDDLSSYDSSLLLSSLHPEIPVNGRVALRGKYSVICVHSNQFYNLRKKCCPSELAYITSLSRCKKWDAQGGKSKAFFAKTVDDRFIIKQIKKTEFESFIKFAPDYFKHVYHSLDTGSQTCLAKILGIYQVKQIRHGKEIKMDLMVMENILFGHNVSRTYDLKGAIFSRHVSDSNDHDTVYLDQNFVDDMRVSPIYIGGRTKHLLQRAIWNDTAFLTSINVMDYSLLVGVDKQKHELVFGIIDYLRQYTWDKQLETWVKTSLVVPKNESPTVISPREYKKRFRKFMSKYFLTVPDDWSTENRSASYRSSCAHTDSTKLQAPQHPNPNPIAACA